MTFMPEYPMASVLRAVELPASGGDTMWANCATAYNDMPKPLEEMADRLWAIHNNETDYQAQLGDELSKRVAAYSGKPKEVFTTEHPIVRVHPETGERVLLCGLYIRRLLGFDGKQSQQILNLLQDLIIRPENCVRWSWRLGDIAMWDNRATQHRSVADFGDQMRRLGRATIHGSFPKDVNGTPSRSLQQHPVAG